MNLSKHDQRWPRGGIVEWQERSSNFGWEGARHRHLGDFEKSVEEGAKEER